MIPIVDRKATGVRLREIMDERGLGARDVQEYLGLGSVQSVYHWLNGISMPSVDNLYALRELFDMPMDEMVCGSKEFCAFCKEETSVSVAYGTFCSSEKPEVRENRTFAYVA